MPAVKRTARETRVAYQCCFSPEQIIEWEQHVIDRLALPDHSEISSGLLIMGGAYGEPTACVVFWKE